MSKSVEQSRAETLSAIARQRAELVAALDSLSNALLEQGFVVSASGSALKFKVEGQQVSDPQFCGGPHNATRFNRTDAENVAYSVIDGNGSHGRAVHVCVALKEAIKSLDDAAALFTAK